MPGRIRAVVEKGPNYVFHLMAVAGIGFVSEYGDRYRTTVSVKDRACLRRHAHLIDFGNGSTGKLSPHLVFLLGYLNCDTLPAMVEYFRLLERCLSGDDTFFSRYRPQLQSQSDWLGVVDPEWMRQSLSGCGDALRDLAEVFIRNFSTYERRVWPKEFAAAQAVADRLNKDFCCSDTVGQWERMTGSTFKYPEYLIVLCSAMQNGPQANSLGYEKNTFWHGSDYAWLTRFISHEVGTHLLIDEEKAVRASGGYPADLVYRAYENLCRFYNARILNEDDPYGMPEWYEPARFEETYRKLTSADPQLTSRQLLMGCVESFLADQAGAVLK